MTLDVRMTNRRKGCRWYECDGCGFNYPETSVVVQEGAVRCKGPNTLGCFDKPGAAVHRRRLEVPYERTPDPLPVDTEDTI